MKSVAWLGGLVAVLLALSSGCGGKRRSDPSSSGDTTGGDAGSLDAGGVHTGGAASGGDHTAGNATGGSETGGAITGGSSTGGVSVGGSTTGGGPTGGIHTAGASTGESGAGGTPSGGSSTGGALGDTGGSNIAGDDSGTGGAGTGGTATEGGAGGDGGDTPAGASLALDRSRMDFGTIVLGTTATDTFTLTNRGASTSGIPNLSVEPSGVTVMGCDAALSPGESCYLMINVTPPELGLFDSFVRITAEPGTDPHLSIYVVGRVRGFEVSPPSILELGDVLPDDPIQHSITVAATTPISDLKVWTVGDELSIDASATTCTETLAAGTSCVVTVRFLALDVGWSSGMVGIRAGGDFGQLAAVNITANATSANDLVAEPEHPPPFVAHFEETTDPVVFTVTNVGDAPSGTITSAVVGEWGSDYAVSDTDCTILAPQESCTVSVVCSPPMSAAGDPRDAVVSITDGNTHLAIPVTATVSFRR